MRRAKEASTTSRLCLSCLVVFGAMLLPGAEGVGAPLDPVGMLPDLVGRGTIPVTLPGPDTATKTRIIEAYGKLPLSFEPNQGQTDAKVKFLSRGRGYRLFLTPTEAVLVLKNQQSAVSGQQSAKGNNTKKAEPASQTILRIQLVGANSHPKIVGLDKLPGKSNYFIGNDFEKWHTNVPNYARVRYQNVYPGVDLIYYGNQQQLEYDLIVAPGADPRTITLEFNGANNLEINERGDLVLHIPGGRVIQHAPVVYQEMSGVKHAIDGHYVLRAKQQVGFHVAVYDMTKPLIIDPELVYSSYLGGSLVDIGNAIAVDAAGNAYVTGSTESGGVTPFPTTGGAFDTTFDGVTDAFVSKVNPAGDALVYSTYLGGSLIDVGRGIAVDAAGNAYVTGATDTSELEAVPFPIVGGFQNTFGGVTDAFLTKLNAGGDALLYSTYLGGSLIDVGRAIAVDAAGNAYVTGATDTSELEAVPFPIIGGSFDTTFGGVTDAFVTKVNTAGSALPYSAYLGGGDIDQGNGIAVDAAGNAYVTGSTDSGGATPFPTTGGAFDTTLGGVTDAFLTKINAAGSALTYSTYLGGSDVDQGNGIALDGLANAYVTGSTFSNNFPTAGSPFQGTLASGPDAFVTKLNPAGGGAADLVYSTYLGGNDIDRGNGIAVDPLDFAYVVGSTDSANFPTASFQAMFGGVTDAFISKIEESPAPPPPPPPGPGDGGGCFIATAAFGSPLASQVKILREFRDRYLLSNPVGRAFVKFYYSVSPPLAEQIATSEILRAIVRVGLVPVLAWVALFLWSPSLGLGLPLVAVGLGSWLPLRAVHRRRHTRANHSVPQAEDEARHRRAALWRRLTLWSCILFVLSAVLFLETAHGEQSQPRSHIELVGDVVLPDAMWFALIRDPESAQLGLYKDGEPIFEGQSALPLGKITAVDERTLIITLPSGQAVEIPEGARLPGPHGLIFVRSALIDALRFQVRVGGADKTEEHYSVVDILGRRATLQRDTIPDESRRASLAEMVNRIPFVEVAPDTFEIPEQSLKGLDNHVGPLLNETLRSASPTVTMEDGVGLKLDNSLGSGTLDRRGFKIEYAKMAQRTGLEVGDVILSVNEQPVNSAGGLVRIYQQLNSDSSVSEVKVLIERNSKLRTLTYHIR